VVPFRELTRDVDRVGILLLAVVSLALGAAFLVSRLIARRITDPIPALIAQMKAVEEGDWEARVDVSSGNELGVLGRSFNQMTSKLKALIEEVYTGQIVRREAELKALQAQINPHFLYNTLDVIYWTAQMEKAPQSAEMVQALARLFKLGLNHGEEFTTVGREVEHLESYLVLQKMRFETPPEVTVDIDPALSPCVTPKLILQPLVENAFVHGLAGLERPGRISVTGRCEDREGPVAVFVVEDNGVGMTQQRLAEVLSDDAANRDSYGVKTVDESLRLFFGREFGLTIESSPGRGTRVTLILPRTTERLRRLP
jgi:two-component system sensor histidine kinase YesM